jgi:hypothetical protein
MRDEQEAVALDGLSGGGSGNSRRQKPRSRPALTVIIAGQRPTEADTPSAARTATLSQAQAPGVPLSLAGAREAASVPLRAADPVSFPPVKREDILGLTATLSAAEPARGHPYRERPYSPLLDTAPGFCGRADRRPAALGALGRGRGAALHRLRGRADGPRWPAETPQAVVAGLLAANLPAAHPNFLPSLPPWSRKSSCPPGCRSGMSGCQQADRHRVAVLTVIVLSLVSGTAHSSVIERLSRTGYAGSPASDRTPPNILQEAA